MRQESAERARSLAPSPRMLVNLKLSGCQSGCQILGLVCTWRVLFSCCLFMSNCLLWLVEEVWVRLRGLMVGYRDMLANLLNAKKG